MNKIRKLKIQLMAAIFLLVFIIAGGLLFSLPIFRNVALALDPFNYSKTMPGATLDVSDWNRLDEDFVAKSGDVMTGVLNMGGHRITNVATPANTDIDRAANVEYVNTAISGAGSSIGGGDTFINWGRSDCPGSFVRLYSGHAFGAHNETAGGPSNVLCLQGEVLDAGSAFSAPYASEIVPLGLASSVYLPTEGGFNTSFGRREVECAVCYKSTGTCYTLWNSDGYDADNHCATGFTRIYGGWAMGGWTRDTREMETDAYCVNSNFSATAPNNLVWGSVFYGMRIMNNSDLPAANYNTSSFVRCAVCCN